MEFLTEWLAAWIRALFFPVVRLTECPAEEYTLDGGVRTADDEPPGAQASHGGFDSPPPPPMGGGEAVRNGEAITTLLCLCPPGEAEVYIYVFEDKASWMFCQRCRRDVLWCQRAYSEAEHEKMLADWIRSIG